MLKTVDKTADLIYNHNKFYKGVDEETFKASSLKRGGLGESRREFLKSVTSESGRRKPFSVIRPSPQGAALRQ